MQEGLIQAEQLHVDALPKSFDELYMSLTYEGDMDGLCALSKKQPDLFFEKIKKDKTVSQFELLNFLKFMKKYCRGEWSDQNRSVIEMEIKKTQIKMGRVDKREVYEKTIGSVPSREHASLKSVDNSYERLGLFARTRGPVKKIQAELHQKFRAKFLARLRRLEENNPHEAVRKYRHVAKMGSTAKLVELYRLKLVPDVPCLIHSDYRKYGIRDAGHWYQQITGQPLPEPKQTIAVPKGRRG